MFAVVSAVEALTTVGLPMAVWIPTESVVAPFSFTLPGLLRAMADV